MNEEETKFDQGEIDGIGVDVTFRVYWLILNGYEVTKENMVDGDLPTRPELHEKNSGNIPTIVRTATENEQQLTYEQYQELINGH